VEPGGDLRIPSVGASLAAHLALPRTAPGVTVPGVVISHGFPSAPGVGNDPAASHPELADRIAAELGFSALAYSARGCGGSDGEFSPMGWLDDQMAAARFLHDFDAVWGVWLVGFGTGGALAISAATQLGWVRGVAALATPADFQDWAAHPRRLAQHARDQGIVGESATPRVADRWAGDLRRLAATEAADRLGDRPLLVVHGADDEVVPSFDARVIADANGAAELRLLDGAGHQLRHDPRAVAVLLGWLDRQRNEVERD